MAQKIDYDTLLNASQLDAVMTLEGPVLVIAGAGSGKTRTLVYRVARLVERGVEPERILLLTFTRKAAQQMLERAAGLADARCRFVSGGTFHSLAHRVLRRHAQILGFENSFTILDRADMEEIIQALIPELKIPKGSGRVPKRSTLANILSKAANLQRPLGELMAEEYAQFLDFTPHLNGLSQLYTEYKKIHQMMDYDDLILLFRRLLLENEGVRKELGRQYRYIMVDEYQDTNAIQADIVIGLSHEHRNVMVVGDDSQAIYSFRGANYRNMFDFPTQFQEAKVIKLEENYRSTQPILTFTNALMAQATEKYTKCLFTKRAEGQWPRVIDTRTEPEQAMFISHFVKEQMQQDRPLSDFAVLFRAAYHSFELEVELARQGIPFVKYGGFKFMESAHIKDFLAHLRVVVNRDDAVSWGRILRLMNHIGPAKSNAIMRWMKSEQVQPGQVEQWPGAGKERKELKALAQLLSQLSVKNMTPMGGVELVMKYYSPLMELRFDDYPRRQKELERLIPMAGRYKHLRGFLDDLALEPPESSTDMDPRERRRDSLTLSTVHSAKGLEWPVVFIIWVMEGRFPPARCYNNPSAMEEERRLMYVAATRAKDQLFLCYPSREALPSWQVIGSGLRNGLSSLVEGLPGDVFRHESMGPSVRWSDLSRGETRVKPLPLDGKTLSPWLSQGDRVRHPAFGPGVVSRMIGQDKAEVLFRNAGRKLLHLEYTTLEKI